MDLISFLLEIANNPPAYGFVFFLYAIATAVFLPIPVEIGLFNSSVHPIGLILILAVGKAVGSLIVYYLGIGIRNTIKKWTNAGPLSKKIIEVCEGFVRKYGYVGLFLIMSIPLMIDSATLYLFSILNPDNSEGHVLHVRNFVFINFFAGLLRGSIVFVVFYFVDVRLL